MPQAQHPIATLIFIVFIVWLVFPDSDYSSQSLTLSDLAGERLDHFQDALNVLNASRWGDFAPVPGKDSKAKPSFLNLTGFRADDNLSWGGLERFRERSLAFSRHAIPPVGQHNLWDAGHGEPIWLNASGTVHGEWVKPKGSISRGYNSYNLSKIAPDMDWIGDNVPWARNITGRTGRMMLRLEGNQTINEYEQLPTKSSVPVAGGLIRSVKGTTTIEDTHGSGHDWEMRLWGVHWPRQGVVLMTTTSEKFEGIFGLPHLTPSEDFFQSSQRLLNESIAHTIATKKENIYSDQTVPWTSDLENPLYTTNPSPHCEYVMYAQVFPPSRNHFNIDSQESSQDALKSVIDATESELQSPVGAPIPKIPKLQMSAIIYSPDCGFFLETKGPPDFGPSEAQHLTGMKIEVQLYQVKTWILVYAIVVFGQVNLLKNQMRESCTPSTMGRVSFWTIAMMLMVDGMTFTAAATWVSSAGATFLPTLALLFAAFLSMTIGGSFLAKVHEVQLPEARPRREREANSMGDNTNGTELPAATTPDRSLLPGPVTAHQPAMPPPPRSQQQPVIVPSDQDIDAEIAAAAAVPGATTAQPAEEAPQSFQSIIGRMILSSLCIIFLAISSTTWYPNLRSLFLNLCVLIYLSLWIPQILRNTRRNCRRALGWPFVVGQSILRLLPVAYFWIKEDNFLYARSDRHAFLVFCAWLWIQLIILAAQDVIGPRFGIPAGWAPDAWDYHPVLREDSLEAGGLPIGLVADDTPGIERARSSGDDGSKKQSTTRSIDCAICREVLEVPVLTAEDEDTGVAGVFARRLYMVTPCRHIFHSACLEGWMRFRLQCPICREELPPL
ncbi:TUL1 RING-domain protein [Fusarium subglutinans]|uniref:DSC E3 ubiquitin ligase complex subunit A n=1 Tax=Gibberella subglutinans TaxID=42677 RepID=A0A8H5UNF8_GIBSU|nr:TUL1 RING-domain protein [Fusarium subglutinans]KAF5593687.1 TUL1 RING-domain protein [Fusarium subglutinans]